MVTCAHSRLAGENRERARTLEKRTFACETRVRVPAPGAASLYDLCTCERDASRGDGLDRGYAAFRSAREEDPAGVETQLEGILEDDEDGNEKLVRYTEDEQLERARLNCASFD